MDATCTIACGRRSRSRPANDAVHAQRDPVGAELAGGLVDDLATMRQEQHTLMPIHCTPRDLGGDHRLAGAGRRHVDHTTHAARYLALDLVDGLALETV